MRKQFLSFICILCIACISINARSQSPDPSIISAGGGSGKTPTLSLDWTIGEYAVETITSTGKMYTQGFHQPLQVSSATITKTTPNGTEFNILVSPNPFINILNFSITSPQKIRAFVTISDGTGVIHQQHNLNSSGSASLQINMSGLPAGSYSLTVRDGITARVITTYKIIKAQ